MVTIPCLHDVVEEILPGIIADRRFLHENPELGFREVKTSKFVAERLETLGVEDIQTGINKTGVTGLIHGTADGPGRDRVVLVRADMDALPILEENDVEYKSRNEGTMHACGHDAHTAILLGLARVLIERRDQFAGTVKVLFQPAEELPPGGAEGMICEGVLENPHVDAVFGLHMAQDLPVGKVSVGPGPVMAAADGFTIRIQGQGGHGAYPSYCVDPIVAGAQIVMALQTLVSRESDPTKSVVISTCFFNSGDAFNVIPDMAELGGTVRTFDPELRGYLQKRLPEVVKGVAKALRTEVDIEYRLGYPSTVNHEGATEIVREAVREVIGEEHLLVTEPKMGGEDFSYFLNERPGAFFFVGSKNEERGLIWGHHHPRFDIDEESMSIGLETMATTVTKYLEQGL